MERFQVRVSAGRLQFSAGHFITYDGDRCEPAHGHDYHVAAEVEGPLDENRYVVDFLALRAMLEGIAGRLDHRMLLPSEHPRMRIAADAAEVTVRFGDHRWVFPRGDCLLLPLANTTSELLAQYLGRELGRRLEEELGLRPTRIRLELSESTGQLAAWEWQPDAPA